MLKRNIDDRPITIHVNDLKHYNSENIPESWLQNKSIGTQTTEEAVPETTVELSSNNTDLFQSGEQPSRARRPPKYLDNYVM